MALNDFTSASLEVRGIIYNFKDGSSHTHVLSILKLNENRNINL